MRSEILNKKNLAVFERLSRFKEFYLAGGTALALRINHRRSADFDLFSIKKISKSLLDKVKKVFADKKMIVSVNNPDELTVFIDGIKTSFIHYHFPLLYKSRTFKGVQIANVEDIAAMKAYAIGRRETYKDYVDLYFILKEEISPLENIVKTAEKKFKGEFNARLFLEQLVYLEDVKDTEIIFLKEKITKESLKKFFEKQVRALKL